MTDRTAHRHECRCGKPIHDGAHLCGACIDRFRTDLVKIADRWPDLEAALTSTEKVTGGGGRPGRSTSTGLALNEQVTRARRTATNAVWFILQVLRDDMDDEHSEAVEAFENAARDLSHRELWEDGVPEILGRLSGAADRAEFDPPRSTDTGVLARWVATWHVPHLTATTAQETTEEVADDLAKAERATFNALDPARWVDVNLACDDHGTTELGERVPCEGTMRARVGRGVLPDLVCSVDPSHTISPAQWERAQWRRTRDLDEEGMRRLVRRIAT